MNRKVFLLELVQASVFDAIIHDDIEDFITKDIISSKDEVYNSFESVITFITHKFNYRCMVKTPTGEVIFRMPKYYHMTSDNTKQCL